MHARWQARTHALRVFRHAAARRAFGEDDGLHLALVPNGGLKRKASVEEGIFRQVGRWTF
jgi:hypothetical protein